MNEPMTRNEFINRLFELYPKDFTNIDSKKAWTIAYNSVLTKKFEVDFDKLLRLVLLENTSKVSAPTPQLLDKLIYKSKVYKEVKSGNEITLETQFGKYDFIKVGQEWNCKTIKDIQNELIEANLKKKEIKESE